MVCTVQYTGSLHHVLTIDPRALKHTKTYASFGDIRPTIRNKPSGLANTWYDITTTPSPRQTPLQVHGYLPNPLVFYNSSRSCLDQSPPFSSLPSMAQPQPISMQSTDPFFPSVPMDLSTMTMLPPMPNPGLSAPFTRPDDLFWFSPVGPSPTWWEDAASEVKPVTITFRPTAPF